MEHKPKLHSVDQRTAVVTGVSGQDGYYLSQLLMEKGYQVIGQSRKHSTSSTSKHPTGSFHPVNFDVTSNDEWRNVLSDYAVDEVYHLAGMTFVPDCENDPMGAFSSNVQSVVALMEAIRTSLPNCRVLCASSSEILDRRCGALDEHTPIRPQSMYGMTKASGFQIVQLYRQRYDLFACNAILFNHESVRRPKRFVIRKISHGVASIAAGVARHIELGALDIYRDWGSAPEYVDCMVRCLAHDQACDFVIGSGVPTQLQSLVVAAFDEVGLDWKDHVRINLEFARSGDESVWFANPSKAFQLLGWKAVTPIEQVVRSLVRYDLSLLTEQLTYRNAG